MSHLYDDGQVEVVVVVGAVVSANAMHVDVQPPAGVLWELLYVDVFHTDAANPSGGWYFNDGVTNMQIGNAAVLNTGIRLALYNTQGVQKLYLDHACYLRYDCPGGCTATEQLTASCIVRKVSGVA